MSAIPSTLLIRQTKQRAKLGAPKAVHYRNGLFDPKSDLEALIEAYGLDNVIAAATAIERNREHERALYPEHFKIWSI